MPTDSGHIRPYPLESTASRPFRPSQTSEGRTSTQVGDDWGIRGVVCLHLASPFYYLFCFLIIFFPFQGQGSLELCLAIRGLKACSFLEQKALTCPPLLSYPTTWNEMSMPQPDSRMQQDRYPYKRTSIRIAACKLGSRGVPGIDLKTSEHV
ncbi:hypothetical protein VTK56DRAFT_6904 [Thermocarpiscus australiensis]